MNKYTAFLLGVLVGLILADYAHLRYRMIKDTRSNKKTLKQAEIKPKEHIKPLTKLRLNKVEVK